MTILQCTFVVSSVMLNQYSQNSKNKTLSP